MNVLLDVHVDSLGDLEVLSNYVAFNSREHKSVNVCLLTLAHIVFTQDIDTTLDQDVLFLVVHVVNVS